MALAARLCHMPRRLPRRPGSRLHKRPGQALGDPPPPLADAVREIWRRDPEGQSETDEHVPPNVVPDVPLLSQAAPDSRG